MLNNGGSCSNTRFHEGPSSSLPLPHPAQRKAWGHENTRSQTHPLRDHCLGSPILLGMRLRARTHTHTPTHTSHPLPLKATGPSPHSSVNPSILQPPPPWHLSAKQVTGIQAVSQGPLEPLPAPGGTQQGERGHERKESELGTGRGIDWLSHAVREQWEGWRGRGCAEKQRDSETETPRKRN